MFYSPEADGHSVHDKKLIGIAVSFDIWPMIVVWNGSDEVVMLETSTFESLCSGQITDKARHMF